MTERMLVLVPALAFLLAACDGACKDCGPADGNGHGDVGAPAADLDWPVPAFRFENQEGKPFGLEDLKGKLWIADFIFTTCRSTCPDMTMGMRSLQTEFEDLENVHFVSFTVDPGHDTPEVLRSYALQNKADLARWHFLRGSIKETLELTRDGFKLGDPEDPMNHSNRFVLVDATGRIRRTYLWTDEDDRERLRKDARRLASTGNL